jgi:hypothetical protein
VPHLTLLFFGAAKDVPEAAKMVTAGTACLHFTRYDNGQSRAILLGRATTHEKVRYQRNHRDDQQNMDQPSGDVESEKSQQPHHNQNHKQR